MNNDTYSSKRMSKEVGATTRGGSWALIVGGLAGIGCTLLTPYPGGGSLLDAFQGGESGISDSQEPLVNPPTDLKVGVLNNLDSVKVALPGASFPVSLNFQAAAANVVGGGIRFEGSDEVQWTLLSKVTGEKVGDVEFSYVVDAGACDDIGNLCHSILAEEFVITEIDSEFHVSEPVEIEVVLQCATCGSTSCVEILPPGSCQECVQPSVCEDLYEVCYGKDAPWEGTQEANVFEQFLGGGGSMWKGLHTCVEGEALCSMFIEDDRCEF